LKPKSEKLKVKSEMKDVKAAPLSPLAAYALWADTYPPFAHNPLMRVEQDVVARLLAMQKATRALDIGTGSGRYLPVLAATGARVVVGLDFSKAMLARCAAGAPRVRADACGLPFRRGAFDLINASLMVGDVRDLGGWACEVARVLAYGGRFVYSDFHPSWARHEWRRTFRDASGATHELAFEPHTIEDHLAALESAKLEVIAIREPRFADDGDGAVRAFRRQWGNPPVVAVFHVAKRGPQ
jgi:malonyl-CoA O-methyltransferase